ncbi:hypothetical protein N8091_01205 [Flavobacteriaceae bacterium]|jgi:hypothetical protein|nr:hypothetical protein [Flavobacteriaceae bacterium]|tara:strand:+ start:1743 stop:2081 length:339 start_codon:yes stop_codon:yes gene_type:complete
MKKIIVTTVLCLFALFLEAQENKFAANRSENAVALISSQMEISDADAEFLQQTLYNKYASNAKKIKGKVLSEDDKRAIYRSAAKETRQRLMTKFNKEEVQKIINLERESFKK